MANVQDKIISNKNKLIYDPNKNTLYKGLYISRTLQEQGDLIIIHKYKLTKQVMLKKSK